MGMLRNTLRNLLTPPATRRYPQEPLRLPPDYRGHIVYSMDKCIFCELCSKRCPAGAIETDKEAKVHRVHRMRCIACGVCVESCPTDAISFDPRYEPPAPTPVVDVYTTELTEHHMRVASLPSFVREPEEVPPGHIDRTGRGGPGEGPEDEGKEPREPPDVRVERPGGGSEEAGSCLECSASEIMVTDVLSCEEGMPLGEAARLMLDNDVGGMPVLDIQGRVVGMLTERDLTRESREGGLRGLLRSLIDHLEGREDEEGLALDLEVPVARVMTSPAITAHEDATCAHLAHLMNEHDINRIPIVGPDDRLMGIVSRADIVRTLTTYPR